MISDIHFDPLADRALLPNLSAIPLAGWTAALSPSESRPFARYGADANYALLRSAVEAAAKRGPYDYVLFLGDALRHNFSDAFVDAGGSISEFAGFARKTELYVIDYLQSHLGAPVVAALGNDDSDCGDYRISPESRFLAGTANHLDVLTSSLEARDTYFRMGYYALPHPVTPARQLIVLNSVYWSPAYSGCQPRREDPGTAEIDWLEGQLASAKSSGHPVTLVMHVPPGIDAYSSSRSGGCASVSMIEARYARRLDALLATYGDTVQVAFAGHTHMDDFRVLPGATSAVLLRLNPSISPIFGNNPAFSAFTYNRRTGVPLDITTYSLPLDTERPAWRTAYQFSAAYGVAFDLPGVRSAISTIGSGGAAERAYAEFFAAQAKSPVTATNARYFTCAQRESIPAQYCACTCAR